MNIVRLGTTYMQHRTDSGRLSSGMDKDETKGKKQKQMQLQNVPRKIRDMYVAEPGYVLVGADFSAIEWVVMMWYASKLPNSGKFHQERLEWFAEGGDPHRLLAASLYQKPEAAVRKSERQFVKPWTYGYWTNAASVGARIGINMADSNRVGAAHERTFRMEEVRVWMVTQAKKRKHAQTALGFTRYMWEWNPKPEEVFAHFGSGTAADLCKLVLLDIFRTSRWEMLTTTHDSIVLHVPEGEADEAAKYLREKMTAPRRGLEGLPLRCEVKVGKNWREVS
jgi:DNA polymerase I-like protein with 3'-5' exonuclease and polymerase domains